MEVLGSLVSGLALVLSTSIPAYLAGRRAQRPHRGPLPSIVDSRRPCVLVVDDERSFLNLMNRELTSMGLEVHPVATLAEAKERLVHGPCTFALAIIDLHLTDGSGLSLLVDLPPCGRCCTKPRTLIYSGREAVELARIRGLSGVDMVLEKNGSLDELEEAVFKLLAMPARAEGS